MAEAFPESAGFLQDKPPMTPVKTDNARSIRKKSRRRNRKPKTNSPEQDINLEALKLHDPNIIDITDFTGQVVLYTFIQDMQQWEKTSNGGTLFVYKRSKSPCYGFTIATQPDIFCLLEQVNKDLEFQLDEPCILYRNSKKSIYNIYFEDKRDCMRIAHFMFEAVRQETRLYHQLIRAGQLASQDPDDDESQHVDVLEMLVKAREEYERKHSPGLSSLSPQSNPRVPEDGPLPEPRNLRSSVKVLPVVPRLPDRVHLPQLVTQQPSPMPPPILWSPHVFQSPPSEYPLLQSHASSPAPEAALPPIRTYRPIILNKSELQDTLIYLLRNDSSFLNTLHDVYLQILSKSLSDVKL
ncbi:mRNA-decapping enzyme 1A isoform X2 [Tachyglossus aculeatus]|uniref:mRNA-decapping enzyme 1A isoform X2 n=1 Tax=Tachyglossus aculeatus TaxID=9261 RepID=UPI0018F6FF51|nr:mRNA-decapping enzyme 1A isoform X2 [Tachyglossus aculeatus]